MICDPRVESRSFPLSRRLVSGRIQLSCTMRRDTVQKQICWCFTKCVKAQPDTAPLTISSIHRFPTHISPHRPVGCLSHRAHRRHEPGVCRGVINGAGVDHYCKLRLNWGGGGQVGTSNFRMLSNRRSRKSKNVGHFGISLPFGDATSTSTGVSGT